MVRKGGSYFIKIEIPVSIVHFLLVPIAQKISRILKYDHWSLSIFKNYNYQILIKLSKKKGIVVPI